VSGSARNILKETLDAKQKAALEAQDAALAAATKAVTDAKESLAQSVANAASARDSAERDRRKEQQKKAAEAAQGVGAIPLALSGAAGTFNPFGIQGLGRSDPVLTELKRQTAIHVKVQRAIDELKKNALVFGPAN